MHTNHRFLRSSLKSFRKMVFRSWCGIWPGCIDILFVFKTRNTESAEVSCIETEHATVDLHGNLPLNFLAHHCVSNVYVGGIDAGQTVLQCRFTELLCLNKLASKETAFSYSRWTSSSSLRCGWHAFISEIECPYSRKNAFRYGCFTPLMPAQRIQHDMGFKTDNVGHKRQKYLSKC